MSEGDRVSRRRVLTAASIAGAMGLAGCSGSSRTEGVDGQETTAQETTTTNGGGEIEGPVPTRYWNDWPVETKNNDNVPFDYQAVEGEQVAPITVNFASDEEPWMREHALMVQRAFNDLGVRVELDDVPTNVMYDEYWPADTGHIVPVTMNTHGPDPQRGLDPNPLLGRMHPENSGNYYNYWNDEITELLNQQRTEVENEQRRANIVKEIQQKASEDAYILSIGFTDVITAANTNRWNGYVPTPGNGTTRDSFIWTQVNLQPQSDKTTWVKGITASMGGLNVAWAAGGPEAKRLTNIYDGLFDASPQLEIVPGLATNADVADPQTIEMDLREGVNWHDGESFGPEDVKFSVELFKEYNAPEMAAFYDPIDSVEVLSTNGGGRVRFNLTEPDASFLTQRVVRSVILPRHRWQDVENPARHNPDNPVGTGPFKFVNWEQGTRFEVEKHEGHWLWNEDVRQEILGDHFVSGPGIDGIVWANVGNVDALIGALRQGDIDAIGTTLANSQAERAARTNGVQKQTAKNFAPLDVHLSHICPLIRDKTFRKALSHTTDKQGFVDSVLEGRATVAQGQNLISPLLQQWHNPDVEPYEYNPSRGQQLLRQAGYTMQGNTLVWPQENAWDAFAERVRNGHASRTDLDQPDFS